MQGEISYIKERVDDIANTLKENITLHQERMVMFQEQMDKRIEGVHARIDTKADKTEVDKKADKIDVEKINSLLTWINRIIVGAIIASLLGLIITSAK